MDSSRRAVESYWRSRTIDAATSDEDKVTPVYKLEEICELLRSSHVSIVKEVSEFVLKRLEHKSPIVKQKALRLIKYAVVKSGVEFRREMQRNSVAVRQLLHYKGQLDPLKGDAPNKAVRETAQEAISAIFSEDNNNNIKPGPVPAEGLNKRIQGFGNTNYEMPSEDKKSFLSEVVGIGSASFKQGISSFTQGHSHKKNDNGSYKGPTLRRSLTNETDYSDRYEPAELRNDAQGSFGISKNAATGPWGRDLREVNVETANGKSASSSSGAKTREERLLDTIVTSGGVRLQPTRDAIQAFLIEAAKLDTLALSHALELKLQSPMWQVRMKAVCVLEALLRRKEDEHFSVVASYFSENQDTLIRCSESPQASLRDKATKVLSLFDGGYGGGSEKFVKAETNPSLNMPDLIDTGDSDDYFGTQDSSKKLNDQNGANPTQAAPLIDDLFGYGMDAGLSATEQKNNDDPFADVSFHTGEAKENVGDLFSSMTINDSANKKASEPFDIFGMMNDIPLEKEYNGNDVNGLVSGLSSNEKSSNVKQKGTMSEGLSENIFADINMHANQQGPNDVLGGLLNSQTAGMNANPMFPAGSMPYNIPANMMLNQAYTSQPMNYAAMGNIFAQQQFLATMSNLQHLANMNAQNPGVGNFNGTSGGYASALPDIFQPTFPNQPPSSLMSTTKKEDTRAFDFISDHVAAARDGKRVV